MNKWFVYIIEKRKRLYVGITTDLGNRLRQHGNATLVRIEGPYTENQAAKKEKMIKKWSKEKKLKYIKFTSQQ